MTNYQKKLCSPEWKKRREEIYQLHNGECQDCGVKLVRNFRNLPWEVHHCAYIPGNHPADHPDSLLMLLCPVCHGERQRLEDSIRVALGKIFKLTPPAKLKQTAWFILDFAACQERAEQAVKTFGGDQ